MALLAETAVGATADELASVPGLFLDLSTALVARRLSAAHGLLRMLGGSSDDKVRSILIRLERLSRIRGPQEYQLSALEHFRHARDMLAATAQLENAAFTLVMGRARRGLGVLGGIDPTEAAGVVKGGAF